VKLGCPKGAAHFRQYGNELGVEAVKRNADDQARKMDDVIKEIQAKGTTSLKAIADELNKMGVPTARNKDWYASSVRNIIHRLQS